MLHDGNGWSAGPGDTRCWGRFGAAGLLIITPGRTALMQHRAEWTSFPLTWGVPGGACDSHESPEATALRETAEETGLREHQLRILDAQVTTGPYVADPNRPELAGGWQYHTVYALAEEELQTFPNEESLELRWVPLADVASLNLLPAFAESWPEVRAHAEKLLEQA
ncbi:NUDIX domain-containing protein [Corynebacterium lactis]|uniref:NUDIX hydrolase n=1 Tax=Corynebacterium lactis RW2-5 TaxID=1408189 RepID=A0A0K2H253_9CORY|nr:NUDIX hydrolase [Corynebacterium lactis]ALA68119.1 NUDIX hydrolase [Corynebacterium lactis RW2-5]